MPTSPVQLLQPVLPAQLLGPSTEGRVITETMIGKAKATGWTTTDHSEAVKRVAVAAALTGATTVVIDRALELESELAPISRLPVVLPKMVMMASGRRLEVAIGEVGARRFPLQKLRPLLVPPMRLMKIKAWWIQTPSTRWAWMISPMIRKTKTTAPMWTMTLVVALPPSSQQVRVVLSGSRL